MTTQEQDAASLKACCKGNVEAMEFLSLWSQYVNLVDDLCDEDVVTMTARQIADEIALEDEQTQVLVIQQHFAIRWDAKAKANRMRGADRVCGMGALAIQLYSHPFYLKNLAALKQIALNCTNAYLDSVRWEDSPEEWKRQWSDHYRHFGSEMVIAVAGICGGWQQMRAVSETLRVICWNSHHDADGNRH